MPSKPIENLNKPTSHRTHDTDLRTQGALLLQFVKQVEEVHAKGRLYLRAGPEWLETTADGRAKLGLPTSESSVVCAAAMLPPELANKRSLTIPAELESARRYLQDQSSNMDSRRVDVYNLGRTFCTVLSGIDAQNYLRSPTAKASIPSEFRRLIDACLGYSSNSRFETTNQLIEELQRANSQEIHIAETVNDKLGRSTSSPSEDGSPNDDRPKNSSGAALPFESLGGHEIIDVIGRGGMGDVYAARDSALDRKVAVKVLPPTIARDKHSVERFALEAQAIAKLSHPNIVPIYSIGEDNGVHFYTMRYIPGPSLADVLRSPDQTSVGQALQWVRQAVAGLVEAHSHGLVHRDIKPSNILIDRARDTAMLADFGLAKSIETSNPMTATGVILGTVDYLSPEQARGEPVDHRSDLYSVGVLLYRVLSGRLPFVAEAPTAVVYQHVHEPPRPLTEVAPQTPGRLIKIVNRLLAKDPIDRYPTAESLLADLAMDDIDEPADWKTRSLSGPANQLPTTSLKKERSSTRHTGGRRFVLALVLLGIATMAAWFTFNSDTKVPEPSQLNAAEVFGSSDWKLGVVENFGTMINSDSNESSPWLSEDGLTLLFASDRPGGYGDGDLWISRRKAPNASWGKPENLGPNVNSPARERSPSITGDGLTLVFEATRGRGPNKAEIFVSRRASRSDPWGEATNLGKSVNTGFNEWNPRITRDGLSIYFSSNRNPSHGFTDIWRSTRASIELPWEAPENLGPTVNSFMGELVASPSADGSVLLLGRRPQGRPHNVRIFMSVQAPQLSGKFQSPVVLKGAVNDHEKSSDPFLSSDNRTLLFSSSRSGGHGENDLYFSKIQPTKE